MRSIDGSAINDVLERAVTDGALPHVAAIAADREGVFYEGGAGVRITGESDDPVSPGTQFRVMSMTKIVCTAAALQLKESGALDFDAPVEEYCPQFAEVRVLEGFDGDTPILVEPASKATVHQLVTHTTGLAYWFWDENLARYEKVTETPNVVSGKIAALSAPMLAHPGTTFSYGINTDWLGQVIESVTGRSLDHVIADGITGPLGMGDTMFRLDDERIANCVTVHVPTDDGGWMSAGELLNQNPDWWPGGHGLYSTPRDYIRFERALLRGGELDGVRILQPETVDAVFSNQLGDLRFPAEIQTADPPITDTLRVGDGYTWGYGLLLNDDDVPGGRRAGTGAWAGLLNTHFFIDRTTGICASIYTNSLPFITPAAWKAYGDFEKALYAAL